MKPPAWKVRPTRRQPLGFTLIELLVVISIIGVLAALALPIFSTVRRKGYQVTSTSNLRQWGTAMVAAASDNNNTLPWEGQPFNLTDPAAWYNQLPPYLSEKMYLDRLTTDLPRAGQKSVWINPAVPISVNATYAPYLFCYAMNDYLSSSSETGPNKTMPTSRIDHPAAVVFMAEKSDDLANCKTSDIKAYFGSGNVQTNPDNGANFLFCDGHVRLLTRREFDPGFNSKVLKSDPPDSSFTFVPFEGATN